MGLIQNLLLSVVHLVFVALDILVVMVLVKVVYDRWRPEWLRSVSNAVEPVMNFVTGSLGAWVERATGKIYSERMLLALFIIFLWLIRFVICGLV